MKKELLIEDDKNTPYQGMFKLTYVNKHVRQIVRHTEFPDFHALYHMLTRCQIDSIKIELDK